MDPQRAYDELIGRAREQSLLGSCSAVLGWDEQTYMPTGGAAHRGSQMALLAGLHHERATDPRVGELLAIVEDSPIGGRARQRRGGECPRAAPGFQPPGPAAAGPGRGAGTDHLAGSAGVGRRPGRERLRRFRPWLEKIVHLKRQEAACLTGSTAKDVGSITGQVIPSGLARTTSRVPRRPTIPCSTSTSRGQIVPTWPFSSRPSGASWCPWWRRSAKPLNSKARNSARPGASSDRDGEAILKRLTPAIGRGSSARPWPRQLALTSGAAGWT